ncbi:MAG: carbamoyl-phosphate synthase large subunit [Clostridia bacterium]|nr:carbamoyl-phosphate synthase large subunit [Clostridia bacterium]
MSDGLKKVLVIGSGPIVIGQAAEFDYAGTQACQALREEGLSVVLLNSNPATIMTDPDVADRVYIEPLTPEFAARVIEAERPDGLLPTLGGQVGLNLAVALHEAGVLDRYGVRLLGTPLEAIRRAEDRELFKATMQAIGQPVPESAIVRGVEEAVTFAARSGYPVIVRPAYTLGGTGGGIARDEAELRATAARGLRQSPIGQVLVEQSVAGWKEIEYEVIRDGRDNCIIVCNMENFDPVGVHTGDSIVVAPSQTLSDRDYHRLRSAALTIIRALGIEGGCNIQFALDPASDRYVVIEVNPRVSRSSALASKATGYPIAKVAAKVAIGRSLDQLVNPVTGSTSALFEPTLDYVVVKIPRWPFDKFAGADRGLGTQMKATGEVMAIGRNFESALLKAVRALETGVTGLWLPAFASLDDDAILAALDARDDRRLFLLAEAIRRGHGTAELSARTGIDRFFLDKIARIVAVEGELRRGPLTPGLLRRAKAVGIADAQIATLTGLDEGDVRERRRAWGILPVYKYVDTCAAEFEAETPYFYSAYDSEDDAAVPPGERRVVVLGSGPIRIGQGIEFDYCSVHAVWALREAGYEAVIINSNPETVSTDFNTADRLYFEPLAVEDVLNVLEREQPQGVIAQFGGQTAIHLAGPVTKAGWPLLGTSADAIDRAEDRERFDALLAELGIPRPAGGTATSVEGAREVAERVGYPVVVRPSYVLGGRAMEIVSSPEELEAYMSGAVRVSARRPVLVDRYLGGVEVEVDAVSDGETVVIPGIMEHVERAGVHSGDSIAVFPAQGLDRRLEAVIEDDTVRIARALGVRGLVNIQFVIFEGQVYVLEVNPRASRTVPFLTKATGIPMVRLAVQAALGHRLADLGYSTGLQPAPDLVAVKMPVFSWAKLVGVDTALGPEMKSTGEVMGVARTRREALRRAFQAAGIFLDRARPVLLTVDDRDKPDALALARRFAAAGFRLAATGGTARFLAEHGLRAEVVAKVEEAAAAAGDGAKAANILDLVRSGGVCLVVNTVGVGAARQRDGFLIRRAAAEFGVPCLTSLDTAAALADTLDEAGCSGAVMAVQDYPLAVRWAARGARPVRS